MKKTKQDNTPAEQDVPVAGSEDAMASQEGGGIDAEIAAITQQIAVKKREIDALEKQRMELVEQRYAQQKNALAGHTANTRRSREISEILREARRPGEDALAGQIRQLRGQMNRLATQGKDAQ